MAGRFITSWHRRPEAIFRDCTWLIIIFAQRWGINAQGEKIKHYYVLNLVGIATGQLIAALHNAGLATLTHTPALMNFLRDICGRPDNEKPVILPVVEGPKEGAKVPKITKKPNARINAIYRAHHLKTSSK